MTDTPDPVPEEPPEIVNAGGRIWTSDDAEWCPIGYELALQHSRAAEQPAKEEE